MATDLYVSPLSTRYTSEEMQRLFSDDWKFLNWRRLWSIIADAQCINDVQEVSDSQAQALRLSVMALKSGHLQIDYVRAAQLEKERRHDVMAHAKLFGEDCPKAAGIIHLGLTSCDITDNIELVQMRDGLKILARKLANAIRLLARFANQYKDLPTLGFTHLQPAQPTTVGKRACMWLYDLVQCHIMLERLINEMPFRGLKGTTGTQDALLKLCHGNHEQVRRIEREVASHMGFVKILPITGQTYTRLLDSQTMQALANLASSIHKICFDLRLLQMLKEVEEPFEKSQIGSSAMAYKRNPMRSERADSLARHVMALSLEPFMTHGIQGLERTLDDSAGRRLYISEAFLTSDALLIIAQNVFNGLVVYENTIRRRLEAELPFIVTEDIIGEMVTAGINRQEAHEWIRQHSQAAGDRVKQYGQTNDLMERLKQDDRFEPVHDRLLEMLEPNRFIGRAALQVDSFLREEVDPLLARYPEADEKIELKV